MFVSLVCPCILFCVISVRPSIHANMGSCLFANFIFTWLQNCYLIVLSYLSSCLHTRCWYMCVSWHRTRSWLLAPCILLVMSWGLLRSDLFRNDIQLEVQSGSNLWCVPGLTWLVRAEISTALVMMLTKLWGSWLLHSVFSGYGLYPTLRKIGVPTVVSQNVNSWIRWFWSGHHWTTRSSNNCVLVFLRICACS